MTDNNSNSIEDAEWGCEHEKIMLANAGNVRICLVKISDLVSFSSSITKLVLDKSWMMDLDPGARRSYERTVTDTAQILTDIFSNYSIAEGVKSDFGELMVSIGSGRALSKLFDHVTIPLAELWKPQVKQNEGFDFHTVCPEALINFGEAKYSSSNSPHGLAISQISDFITQEKHLRDRPHLVNLVSQGAIDHLDNDEFGVIAAFSLNTIKPLIVLDNALASINKFAKDHEIEKIYLVGVIHES